jgi:hypothetical protein
MPHYLFMYWRVAYLTTFPTDNIIWDGLVNNKLKNIKRIGRGLIWGVVPEFRGGAEENH